MWEISYSEVEEVVMEMPRNKSPRLDGFKIDYFHAFWKFIEPKIHAFVEKSRGTQKLWCGLSSMFIILIPKFGKS